MAISGTKLMVRQIKGEVLTRHDQLYTQDKTYFGSLSIINVDPYKVCTLASIILS